MCKIRYRRADFFFTCEKGMVVEVLPYIVFNQYCILLNKDINKNIMFWRTQQYRFINLQINIFMTLNKQTLFVRNCQKMATSDDNAAQIIN